MVTQLKPARLNGLRLTLLIALLMSGCERERQESQYSDLTSAQVSVAWRGGWIPIWLPRSAKDIHEIHDLDTNRQLLAFEFEENDLPALRAASVAAGAEELRHLQTPDFNVAWWPRDLQNERIAVAVNSGRFEIRTHADVERYGDGIRRSVRAFLAIDGKNRAFIWR